jgi:uncharacterized membrane protein YqjE
MNHPLPLSEHHAASATVALTEPQQSEPSLSSLLGGIVSDLQKLIEDHLKLLRMEVQDDFEQSKAAILPMVLGGGLMAIAVAMLFAMLVGWLNWLIPEIPWFGWAGILAITIGGIGAILWFIGKTRLNDVNPMPEATLKTVKESIQCISDQVNTD